LVGHLISFCFWFDHRNRRTFLTRHDQLRRTLIAFRSARLATLAFAPRNAMRVEFTETTLHSPEGRAGENLRSPTKN
jgi:hypothetical protein